MEEKPRSLLLRFDSYPDHIRSVMENLRQLILETAEKNELGRVEETLKWGEPSYLVKGGSPVRIDWKEKTPDKYFIFFNCNTKLVDTFRELYSGTLEFQGSRAIVFDLQEKLSEDIVCHCLELAMTYKKTEK